jgi:hypothetical protein
MIAEAQGFSGSPDEASVVDISMIWPYRFGNTQSVAWLLIESRGASDAERRVH